MKRSNFEQHHGSGSGSGGGGGGGGNSASKRPRGDKFECRILVPSKVAGSIIGKGGSNIQKLRTENSANIRIPDCPGPERCMTVLCQDTEAAVQVLGQTIPFMNLDSASTTASDEDNLEVRLLIHQSIVGGVIGRAGFKIKEIREGSGANIKVFQHCAPQSTDRCIAITGANEKICKAATEIFNVVNITEIKGLDQPYDPINFDAYYANEYGGFGSANDLGGGGGFDMGGGGGGGGRRGGGGGGRDMRGGGGWRNSGGMDRGGRYGNGPPDFGGGGFRGGRGGGGFGGNRGGFNRGGGGFGGGGFNDGGGFGGQFDQGGYDNNFRGGGGGGGGSGNGGGNNYDDGGETESTQVTIPKDMAGAIIGPGGSRIRKIRNDSKAGITIDEAAPGTNERIITITGSKRQIQTAQYLLQQSVRENSGGGGGGGGGGNGNAGGGGGYY